jgi:ABC-2 type transport system ATP-binding protein
VGRDNRKLSGGQLQRLLLGIALVNDPQVLFLDEPTTGLDPQARHNFWDLIRAIKAERRTVLLTTHYMEEAYFLCDVVAIMDHGRIIAEGPPSRLLKEHFDDVVLELPREDFGIDPASFPLPVLLAGDRVEISTADVELALRALLDRGINVRHLRIRPRNLEDLFLELTGRELRT